MKKSRIAGAWALLLVGASCGKVAPVAKQVALEAEPNTVVDAGTKVRLTARTLGFVASRMQVLALREGGADVSLGDMSAEPDGVFVYALPVAQENGTYRYRAVADPDGAGSGILSNVATIQVQVEAPQGAAEATLRVAEPPEGTEDKSGVSFLLEGAGEGATRVEFYELRGEESTRVGEVTLEDTGDTRVIFFPLSILASASPGEHQYYALVYADEEVLFQTNTVSVDIPEPPRVTVTLDIDPVGLTEVRGAETAISFTAKVWVDGEAATNHRGEAVSLLVDGAVLEGGVLDKAGAVVFSTLSFAAQDNGKHTYQAQVFGVPPSGGISIDVNIVEVALQASGEALGVTGEEVVFFARVVGDDVEKVVLYQVGADGEQVAAEAETIDAEGTATFKNFTLVANGENNGTYVFYAKAFRGQETPVRSQEVPVVVDVVSVELRGEDVTFRVGTDEQVAFSVDVSGCAVDAVLLLYARAGVEEEVFHSEQQAGGEGCGARDIIERVFPVSTKSFPEGEYTFVATARKNGEEVARSPHHVVVTVVSEQPSPLPLLSLQADTSMVVDAQTGVTFSAAVQNLENINEIRLFDGDDVVGTMTKNGNGNAYTFTTSAFDFDENGVHTYHAVIDLGADGSLFSDDVEVEVSIPGGEVPAEATLAVATGDAYITSDDDSVVLQVNVAAGWGNYSVTLRRESDDFARDVEPMLEIGRGDLAAGSEDFFVVVSGSFGDVKSNSVHVEIRVVTLSPAEGVVVAGELNDAQALLSVAWEGVRPKRFALSCGDIALISDRAVPADASGSVSIDLSLESIANGKYDCVASATYDDGFAQETDPVLLSVDVTDPVSVDVTDTGSDQGGAQAGGEGARDSIVTDSSVGLVVTNSPVDSAVEVLDDGVRFYGNMSVVPALMLEVSAVRDAGSDPFRARLCFVLDERDDEVCEDEKGFPQGEDTVVVTFASYPREKANGVYWYYARVDVASSDGSVESHKTNSQRVEIELGGGRAYDWITQCRNDIDECGFTMVIRDELPMDGGYCRERLSGSYCTDDDCADGDDGYWRNCQRVAFTKTPELVKIAVDTTGPLSITPTLGGGPLVDDMFELPSVTIMVWDYFLRFYVHENCTLADAINSVSLWGSGGMADTYCTPADDNDSRYSLSANEIVVSSDVILGEELPELKGKVRLYSNGENRYSIRNFARADGFRAEKSMLRIASGSVVTLENIVIDGHGVATTDHGGCIFNEGDLTLNNVTVSQCRVEVAAGGSVEAGGGGIYSVGPSLTISQSWIEQNRVIGFQSASGREIQGGGIFVRGGTLKIDRTTITGNWVLQSEAENGISAGGGIAAVGVDDIDWTSVHITDNFVVATGPRQLVYGGGAYVWPQYVWPEADVSLSAADCTISGNSIVTGGYGMGAGLYLASPSHAAFADGGIVVTSNTFADAGSATLGTYGPDLAIEGTGRLVAASPQ